MEARGHDRRAGVDCGDAAFEQLCHRLPHRSARIGAHLDLGEEGLVIHALAREVDLFQNRVRHVGEREGVAIHEQQLLLEAHREGLALAEPVRRRRAAGALPLAHGVSPSAARAAIRPNTSAAARPLA
jgi:hypothetical protein